VGDIIRWNGGSDYVAGVIVEPITGANGVIVPPDGYLQRLREICDELGVLLIADEVMVGFGRTGEWFACDHWGVVPDILTISKGITNGQFPLAATVIREDLARVFEKKPFLHGHTASGNTTGCAVAVRAIEIYRTENLVQRSREMGAYLRERALWLQDRHVSVGDVRGLGLFVGLELVRDRDTREPLAPWPQRFPVASTPLNEVLAECRAKGLFMMMAHPSLLHLAPPLTITTDEIDEAIAILDQALLITDRLCPKR
jgi:taurine--2-oxoglutarate transaminase